MGAAALALPKGLGTPDLKDFSAFIGLTPKASPSRNVPAHSRGLFKAMAEVSDDLVLYAISEHTVDGFRSKRDEVLENYIKSVVALSEMIEVIIPQINRAQLFEEAVTGVQSFLRAEALPRFGTDVAEQAVFTAWTMQKTHRVLVKIANSEKLAKKFRTEDRKLSRESSLWALWSLFHLDCLITAIKHDKSIHPEVLEEISDGLRSAVNAYGVAKQGLNLRRQPTEPITIEPAEWDEEDQALLDDSMHDLERVPPRRWIPSRLSRVRSIGLRFDVGRRSVQNSVTDDRGW